MKELITALLITMFSIAIGMIFNLLMGWNVTPLYWILGYITGIIIAETCSIRGYGVT